MVHRSLAHRGRGASAHTDARRRKFPSQPAEDELLRKDLSKAEHDTVHERQEQVDADARDQRERARLRRECRVEDGRGRGVPRRLVVVVRVMVPVAIMHVLVVEVPLSVR